MYVDAWRKAQSKKVLSPLQTQIVQVIEDHPEYQSTLNKKNLDVSFTPKNSTTNLFLHMSLHLAIRDQISMNTPKGISNIFQFLIRKYSNNHEVEHRMLDCLAETLWESQNRNTLPDEQKYLERLQKLS
jgi:hypothetical protein